jgi:hypothetical protein
LLNAGIAAQGILRRVQHIVEKLVYRAGRHIQPGV